MGLFSGIGKALGKVGGSIGTSLGGFDLGLSGAFEQPGQSNAKQFRSLVESARRIGISPLAALKFTGGQSTRPGGFSLSGNIANAYDDKAMPEGQEYGPTMNDLLIGTQMEETKARTKLLEAETRMMESKAARSAQQARTEAAAAAQASYMPGQIEAHRLDPSYIQNSAGRLTSWRDATGKWQTVDQHTAPSEPLEAEYGESAELQGLARLGKGMYGYGGLLDWPSLEDLIGR